MTVRKLCGFDINGWRDMVARNWQVLPGDVEQIGEVTLAESGPLSSVVLAGDGKAATWIGGRQADLAPHGRGEGWGLVGSNERRLEVRTLLDNPERRERQLAAAFSYSARGAAYSVASIDDVPETTEQFQESLLTALGEGRVRNPMLVWRSVLTALFALDCGLVAADQTIAIISQSTNGLAFQTLKLRRTSGASGEVIAPERRQAGIHLRGNVGYSVMVENARRAAIGSDGENQRTEHRARARSVGHLALGMPRDKEVLRLFNGYWEFLDLSCVECVPERVIDTQLPDADNCAVILVETLSEGPVRKAILDQVYRSYGSKVVALPADAVARGALIAAQRLNDGEPVYFDFLPRLSTIVFGHEGVHNFDLIDDRETLEAGRIYRSPKPAEFAIPAGRDAVSIYLRKETELRPRKAIVNLSEPPTTNIPVELWVEQTPAKGRAKIVLEARSIGRQFIVDWERAVEEPRDWEEIIATERDQVPSVPNRLVLKSGMIPWHDSDRADGLFALLDKEVDRPRVDWDSLAAKLSSRPFGEYCISSDGELPEDIPATYLAKLDRLTQRALDHNAARLGPAPKNSDPDNAALKFLTWQFRRCPQVVVDWLVDCIEGQGLEPIKHPFAPKKSNLPLIFQGVGRIAASPDAEKRILRAILATDIQSWSWRNECAAVAFLLSRSDTAPMLLEPEDIERLVERTVMDFNQELGSQYNRFNYAPFLLAGLLRWRLKTPNGLVLGSDPLANRLLSAVESVERDLNRKTKCDDAFQRKREKYLPILADLKDELEGKGGNPDLLLQIYSL